jgi:hypothetical protein
MVDVADVFPTKHPLCKGEKEDRQEAERDAQEHDLARRYFFGSPFHEDEIASPDHPEQGKSDVGGFLHFITRDPQAVGMLDVIEDIISSLPRISARQAQAINDSAPSLCRRAVI